MIDDIRSNIFDILDELPSDSIGLHLDEVYASLLTRLGKVNLVDVKRVVYSMADEQVLEMRSDPERPNEKIYHFWEHRSAGDPYTLNIFEYIRMQTRDEIEREGRQEHDLWLNEELDREKTSLSVLQEIASGHAREASFAEQIRKVAPRLAQENPIEIILEMAQWVIEDLNRYAEKLAAIAQSNAEEVKRLTREIGFRRKKAVRFFQRLWRLDEPTNGAGGIMHIPTVAQMTRRRPIKATIDLQLARERLKERVIGNHIVDVVSMPPNMHKAAIGTDASVGDVRVKHEQGSFIPPTPAVLFVASAAMRSRNQDTILPYWDFDIEPRDLEKYEDMEAAEEGLLISPRLRREAITDFRHLRSAAMELRQYKEELRVIGNRADWRPIGNIPELVHPPEITLLLRDGRLFPLVHRIDDYDGASAPDDVLYGTVVRREIEAFHDVFLKSAGLGRLGPIYSGAVKSPEFSWFSMLVFWYLHTKCGQKDMADGFYRPILNDQAVTHLLFWGMANTDKTLMNNPRNVFVTFRAIRRFSDIAFQSHPLPILDDFGEVERILDENNEDDWIDYIQQHIQDADIRYSKLHKRGVPSLGSAEAYRPFLNLCKSSGVAMFYGVPARMYHPVIESGSHFLFPRWEIAVDVTTLSNRNLDEKLGKMFAWLTDEGGLVRDETHAIGGFEEVQEGLPLFIPDVVMQAHETVVFTKLRHVPDVEEMLRNLIRDIRDGKLPSIQN